MSGWAWAGVVLGLLLGGLIMSLAFVKPDFDRYPDGLWPPKEDG